MSLGTSECLSLVDHADIRAACPSIVELEGAAEHGEKVSAYRRTPRRTTTTSKRVYNSDIHPQDGELPSEALPGAHRPKRLRKDNGSGGSMVSQAAS